MMVFWTFGKGLDVLWVAILQFWYVMKLLRWLCTTSTKFCTSGLFQNGVLHFTAHPEMVSFQKNREKSKRCVFVGVSNRKLCCGRVLELQRCFEKFSFVPVQKQNELLETQNCKSSGITEKFVRVCKDPLIPSWKPNYLLETALDPTYPLSGPGRYENSTFRKIEKFDFFQKHVDSISGTWL